MRYEFTDGPLKMIRMTGTQIADVIEVAAPGSVVPAGEYRLTSTSEDTARYEWLAAREVRGHDEGDTAH